MKTICTILLLCLVGCTDNERAKNFGDTETVEPKGKTVELKGKRLIAVTWKGEQLWYVTRPIKSDEEPETFEFKEKSSWGIVEGSVIFKESK